MQINKSVLHQIVFMNLWVPFPSDLKLTKICTEFVHHRCEEKEKDASKERKEYGKYGIKS